MVRKANGKWRICTDYIILNKVCPKDTYPLPSIDKPVDNAFGFQLLSFLDSYLGYNKIKMHPLDKEKIAFIVEDADFYYRVMPFGLKNTRATFQRIMNQVFKHQIGQNVKV